MIIKIVATKTTIIVIKIVSITFILISHIKTIQRTKQRNKNKNNKHNEKTKRKLIINEKIRIIILIMNKEIRIIIKNMHIRVIET